jgi:hypothetical protein
MPKIQIQTEIDFQGLLDQMPTTDIEAFVQEASSVLVRRKAGEKNREHTLLRRLNEECALPDEHWRQYRELLEKRQITQSFSPSEQEQFDVLVREEEQMRLKRIKILGELAQLKGLTLDQIAAKLGLDADQN